MRLHQMLPWQKEAADVLGSELAKHHQRWLQVTKYTRIVFFFSSDSPLSPKPAQKGQFDDNIVGQFSVCCSQTRVGRKYSIWWARADWDFAEQTAVIRWL